MNQLSTTTRTNLMPAPADKAVNEARRLVCWTPDDPTKPMWLTRSLSTTERQQIEGRIAVLTEALEGGDRALLERSIAAMLLTFPSSRASSDEARTVVAAYAGVMADMPAWSVAEAARRWARGGVSDANPAFAPSAAQLHQIATLIVGPLRGELFQLRRMLEAVVAERETSHASAPPEARKAIRSQEEADAARMALESRAAAMGIDGAEALAKTPNAPPRDNLGTWKTLDVPPIAKPAREAAE